MTLSSSIFFFFKFGFSGCLEYIPKADKNLDRHRSKDRCEVVKL